MTAWTAKWAPIGNNDGFVISWGPMLQGDTAGAIMEESNVAGFADRSVQVSGTFGGASVDIQGSNDGVNFSTLNDPASVALSFTTAKIKAILEATRQIMPVITGGDGTTAITVSMFMRKLK